MTPFQPPATGSQQAITHSVWFLMTPLMLVLFISTLDQTIVATALHGIGLALGNADEAPWITTSYLLTSAIATLIFGKLGDMIGRKKVFQACIVVFALGSLLCAMATTMLWLVVFRGLQGIGGGALNSLVMTIVGDLVPPRERPKYQALSGIVPAIAIIVGPMLGGFLVQTLGWQWIFLLNVPVGALAFVIVGRRLHLPARVAKHRIDIAGALLVTLFASSLLLSTVVGGTSYAWSSWQVLSLIAVGAAGLALYIVVERRAAEPITPPRLFSNGAFVAAAGLFFLAAAMLFAGMLFVPLMLQTVYGYSAFTAGACAIPLLLGLIVAAALSGGMISRTGRYKMFPVIGALLSGSCLALLACITQETALWQIMLLLSFAGAGIGFMIQVALLAGQNAVDAGDLGVATGALNFFKSFGGAVGAAVFGALLASTAGANGGLPLHGFAMVYLSAAALGLPALLLALLPAERPLSDAMREVAEGKVEVPEY